MEASAWAVAGAARSQNPHPCMQFVFNPASTSSDGASQSQVLSSEQLRLNSCDHPNRSWCRETVEHPRGGYGNSTQCISAGAFTGSQHAMSSISDTTASSSPPSYLQHDEHQALLKKLRSVVVKSETDEVSPGREASSELGLGLLRDSKLAAGLGNPRGAAGGSSTNTTLSGNESRHSLSSEPGSPTSEDLSQQQEHSCRELSHDEVSNEATSPARQVLLIGHLKIDEYSKQPDSCGWDASHATGTSTGMKEEFYEDNGPTNPENWSAESYAKQQRQMLMMLPPSQIFYQEIVERRQRLEQLQCHEALQDLTPQNQKEIQEHQCRIQQIEEYLQQTVPQPLYAQDFYSNQGSKGHQVVKEESEGPPHLGNPVAYSIHTPHLSPRSPASHCLMPPFTLSMKPSVEPGAESAQILINSLLSAHPSEADSSLPLPPSPSTNPRVSPYGSPSAPVPRSPRLNARSACRRSSYQPLPVSANDYRADLGGSSISLKGLHGDGNTAYREATLEPGLDSTFGFSDSRPNSMVSEKCRLTMIMDHLISQQLHCHRGGPIKGPTLDTSAHGSGSALLFRNISTPAQDVESEQPFGNNRDTRSCSIKSVGGTISNASAEAAGLFSAVNQHSSISGGAVVLTRSNSSVARSSRAGLPQVSNPSMISTFSGTASNSSMGSGDSGGAPSPFKDRRPRNTLRSSSASAAVVVTGLKGGGTSVLSSVLEDGTQNMTNGAKAQQTRYRNQPGIGGSAAGFKSKDEVVSYVEQKLESMDEPFTFKSGTYQTHLKRFLPRPEEKHRKYIERIEIFPRIPTSLAERAELGNLRRVCAGMQPEDRVAPGDSMTIKDRLDEMLTSLVNKIMFLLVVKFDTWYIHAPAREQIREQLLEFIWPGMAAVQSFFREHFTLFIDMRIRHFRDSVARYFRDRPRTGDGTTLKGGRRGESRGASHILPGGSGETTSINSHAGEHGKRDFQCSPIGNAFDSNSQAAPLRENRVNSPYLKMASPPMSSSLQLGSRGGGGDTAAAEVLIGSQSRGHDVSLGGVEAGRLKADEGEMSSLENFLRSHSAQYRDGAGDGGSGDLDFNQESAINNGSSTPCVEDSARNYYSTCLASIGAVEGPGQESGLPANEDWNIVPASWGADDSSDLNC